MLPTNRNITIKIIIMEIIFRMNTKDKIIIIVLIKMKNYLTKK
jgi:hypothetical protein